MSAPLCPAHRRDAVLGAQVAELRDARRGGAPKVDAVAQTHLGWENHGKNHGKNQEMEVFGWKLIAVGEATN